MSGRPVEQIDAKLAPIEAGGVYRLRRASGEVEEVLCVATLETVNGAKEGRFLRYGYPDESAVAGTKEMLGWDLVGRMARLKVPVVADRRETEVERLTRELAEAKARLL